MTPTPRPLAAACRGRPLRRAATARAAALLALACLASTAQASPPAEQRLRLRALAATCAQCHGTDGHAQQGEATIRLAGLDGNYILTQLMAFRTGQRPATIMHQITRGYSPEQLEALSAYFAALK